MIFFLQLTILLVQFFLKLLALQLQPCILLYFFILSFQLFIFLLKFFNLCLQPANLNTCHLQPSIENTHFFFKISNPCFLFLKLIVPFSDISVFGCQRLSCHTISPPPLPLSLQNTLRVLGFHLLCGYAMAKLLCRGTFPLSALQAVQSHSKEGVGGVNQIDVILMTLNFKYRY